MFPLFFALLLPLLPLFLHPRILLTLSMACIADVGGFPLQIDCILSEGPPVGGIGWRERAWGLLAKRPRRMTGRGSWAAGTRRRTDPSRRAIEGLKFCAPIRQSRILIAPRIPST